MGRLFLLGYRENIACCHDEKHNRANLRHFAHPLSGERSRREITLAQGRSRSIIVDAHTKSQTYYRKACSEHALQTGFSFYLCYPSFPLVKLYATCYNRHGKNVLNGIFP